MAFKGVPTLVLASGEVSAVFPTSKGASESDIGVGVGETPTTSKAGSGRAADAENNVCL